jgi:hypothetical protein
MVAAPKLRCMTKNMMNFAKSKFSAVLAGTTLSLVVVGSAWARPLVVVNTGNVGNLIAVDLDVDISQIPVTVQAPIGIAANVCGVAANVLVQQIQQDGTAECNAQTTSTAFNRIVQEAIQE